MRPETATGLKKYILALEEYIKMNNNSVNNHADILLESRDRINKLESELFATKLVTFISIGVSFAAFIVFVMGWR